MKRIAFKTKFENHRLLVTVVVNGKEVDTLQGNKLAMCWDAFYQFEKKVA
ncbi:MAG: hypothetical protein ACK5NC_11510 [Vibrio sp.]